MSQALGPVQVEEHLPKLCFRRRIILPSHQVCVWPTRIWGSLRVGFSLWKTPRREDVLRTSPSGPGRLSPESPMLSPGRPPTPGQVASLINSHTSS